jgi:hypothetical protein
MIAIEPLAARLLALGLPLFLALALCGCVSKAKADAQARAAFLAGQQQARQQMQPAREAIVTFVGPVERPTLPWTQDMTLARALVTAGYHSPTDPSQIIIVRNGQGIPVDVNKLLQGEDVPLQPGDVVSIK